MLTDAVSAMSETLNQVAPLTGLAILTFALVSARMLLPADLWLMAERLSQKVRRPRDAHDAEPERPDHDLREPEAAAPDSGNQGPNADGRDGQTDQADQLPAPADTAQQDQSQPAPAFIDRPDLDARCKMDLAATRDGLELTVELPGLQEKDIDIEVMNDRLTISGELRFDPGGQDKNYRLTERGYGVFTRSVDLPEGVQAEKIRATLIRGVLTVIIPNPVKPEPRKIEVHARQVRVIETSYGLQLSVELPGLNENDIVVTASEGWLSVRGAGRPEFAETGWSADAAESDDRFLLRLIELPRGVRFDQISAVLSNGVLKVVVPGLTDPDPKTIAVRAAA